MFANWSNGRIGSTWHGDYHTNYNLQQPFWVTFSSNHVDKHLAYADLVDFLLPVSRAWARDYYGLPGAFFPHSAYPVEMHQMPYPVPTWGAEVCETPWVVQSLWWHYLYTMDVDFLRDRAFGPIREAVQFLNAYIRRARTRGYEWDDDDYHIYPTVAPELHGLRVDPRFSADCNVDLTLTKFVFGAYLKACRLLGLEESEAVLMSEVQDILDHFPAYPTAESERGTVYVSVSGESPEQVYNTPNPLACVFPGEDVGLHSSTAELEIALTTWRNQRTEGGNELVFQNLQGARLGALDLEKFKRQIDYCLLPNGTCTDMVLQVGGRYMDQTPYDYMARMGIWFENFSLPVVINECLLQSYTGELRLFPNWPDGSGCRVSGPSGGRRLSGQCELRWRAGAMGARHARKSVARCVSATRGPAGSRSRATARRRSSGRRGIDDRNAAGRGHPPPRRRLRAGAPDAPAPGISVRYPNHVGTEL